MRFIGQYIQSFIARFRSDVYLEDISTGTIASGGNLGLDSNNKIVKATEASGDLTSIVAGTGLSGTSLTGPIPTLNVDASQTQITAVGTIGTGVWQGTAIATAYIADDAVTEDKLANTLLAEIDANTAKVTNVSTNLSQTTASDSLRINSSDGTNVIIAEASGSIAGVMTVAHHDKLDGIETSATADQTKSDIDGLAITTVGTIDTGVWNGTAIATDYLKHKSTFELAGYAVADGTNYMMADIMSGNKAPFLHDETSIGANGTTADNPAAFLRAAGTVMPYNGTLKIWKGWGASNGTPTVDIGIFKYSPTADDATSDSLVLVKNTQITGAGNDNLKAFSETSFSVTVTAGDILITAIKGSVNANTAYFTSTVEIEWTS